MPELPLPAQSVQLSSTGFDQLYELVRADRALAKLVAERIEEDPRSALHHVFKLTKTQKLAIENTSDDELRRRASRLIAELRSASPRALHFDPGPTGSEADSGGKQPTCGCAMA
jgi:hypothetical protein